MHCDSCQPFLYLYDLARQHYEANQLVNTLLENLDHPVMAGSATIGLEMYAGIIESTTRILTAPSRYRRELLKVMHEGHLFTNASVQSNVKEWKCLEAEWQKEYKRQEALR